MNKLIDSLKTEDIHTISDVIGTLLASGAKTATKYISERLTIRASLKLFHGKLPTDTRTVNIALTIGTPNYEARQFIKICKKAGETFPIRKIQLKFPPAPKKEKNAKTK